MGSKEKTIKRKLNKVYKEISNERGHYCSGCGSSAYPLSHSHIIPRSRRKDLETDKDNITYHCLDMDGRKGCHTMWEGNERIKLLDYHKNIEYILEKDVEYFYIITELNEKK